VLLGPGDGLAAAKERRSWVLPFLPGKAPQKRGPVAHEIARRQRIWRDQYTDMIMFYFLRCFGGPRNAGLWRTLGRRELLLFLLKTWRFQVFGLGEKGRFVLTGTASAVCCTAKVQKWHSQHTAGSSRLHVVFCWTRVLLVYKARTLPWAVVQVIFRGEGPHHPIPWGPGPGPGGRWLSLPCPLPLQRLVWARSSRLLSPQLPSVLLMLKSSCLSTLWGGKRKRRRVEAHGNPWKWLEGLLPHSLACYPETRRCGSRRGDPPAVKQLFLVTDNIGCTIIVPPATGCSVVWSVCRSLTDSRQVWRNVEAQLGHFICSTGAPRTCWNSSTVRGCPLYRHGAFMWAIKLRPGRGWKARHHPKKD